MTEVSKNSNNRLNIANITTYQSGVAQASAFRVVKQCTDQILKQYNLTSMQWFVLGTVLDAGKTGIRVSDIAEKLTTTVAYMTTTINLLESRGMLTKTMHEHDGRTKVITINPSYVKTCHKIEESLRERLREVLYKTLTREELTTYISVLYKLSALQVHGPSSG